MRPDRDQHLVIGISRVQFLSLELLGSQTLEEGGGRQHVPVRLYANAFRRDISSNRSRADRLVNLQ